MGIEDAKDELLSQTAEEDVYFVHFNEPRPLRRPVTGMKALAALHFGAYREIGGAWVEDERVVWLGMIMSGEPGEGARLLKQIRRLAAHHDLAICGEPVALIPKNWDETRFLLEDANSLIAWHLRQRFKVVQTKWATRLWCVPPGLQLTVSVELEDCSRQ